ncbi:Hsp70 family protein [Parafrankia sp. FMc2]|uniref:Hsp70 family protein n=1 Tax=Parafrankia sp. FMc2 TaxID=3233196 RepID=UPI0034D5998C
MHAVTDRASPEPDAVIYGLGVDLGTTFTAVATGRPGRLEMVSLGSRSTAVPSVAFATAEGQLLTGDAAERRAGQEPERAAREFKRRLGDPTPMLLGGTPFAPAALLAAALRDAVAAAVRLEGAPPARVVLSRPAVWGPYRLEQFEQVPQLAGLAEVELVTEPVAAATAYAERRNLSDGDVLAVYDLGGGTFDSAIVLQEGGRLRLLGTPEGVEWLGGVDFDEAVLRHVDEELGGAVTAADPGTDALALTRLRHECVLAKEALTFDEETAIPVFLSGARRQVRLTRARFEELAAPAVTATVEGLRRALESADVTPGDLTAVLLAGGSSQIPLVARTVEKEFGRPVLIDIHPKHVVALGAAQIAASLLPPAEVPWDAAPATPAAPVAPAEPIAPAQPPAGPGSTATVPEPAGTEAQRPAADPDAPPSQPGTPPWPGAPAQEGASPQPGATSESETPPAADSAVQPDTDNSRRPTDGPATSPADGSWAPPSVGSPAETATRTAAEDGTEAPPAGSSPAGRKAPGPSQGNDSPPAGETPKPPSPARGHRRLAGGRSTGAARRPPEDDRPPGISRREVMIALAIAVVVLALATVVGTVYGYATRTKAPESDSAPPPRATTTMIMAAASPLDLGLPPVGVRQGRGSAG